MDEHGGPAQREVTVALVRAALAYVARAAGASARREVLAVAGLDPDDPRFASDEHWVSGSEAVALAEAAAVRCGDAQIGRRAGEEYFRIGTADGTVEFLRAQHDPGLAVEVAAEFSNRMSTGRRFYRVVAVGPRSIEVDATIGDDPIDRHWLWCQLAIGYWAQIPSLFGATGVVTEPRCAHRGDEGCTLVVRWDEPLPVDDESRRLHEETADKIVGRFEDLQSLAVEMVTAHDVPTMLERVMRGVSLAIMAHRFVLTVRRRPGAPTEVFSVGLRDDLAERASDALWAGESVSELGEPVVVSVASERQDYGHLAAYLPHGAAITDVDRRHLRAYAGHAAAALERVVTMEAAARDHRATAALLGLSQDLVSARSATEVACRVSAAVPEVVGCDLAGVWLVDHDEGQLRMEGSTGTVERAGPMSVPLVDRSVLDGMAADPRPYVVERSAAKPGTSAVLSAWGMETSYVAPIVHRGALHGLLVAASTEPPVNVDVPMILQHLAAIANHASTAIGNATLVAQMHHQAMHDSLTGLPNRPQIEQRVLDALEVARDTGTSVAIAFVDLDRFKNVNDTLGHGAGDELICMVGARLQDSVRAADVVARLGGDEFLVMMPLSNGLGDAQVVADKILAALRQPFSVAGESLFISASVGLACYPDHGTDYGTLLVQADAAMYAAKSRGRNTFAVHADEPARVTGHKLKLEGDLHRALEREELLVAYQPQVDLQTGAVVGAEALIRWQHPTLGLLGPDRFLGIAEDSGLIVDMDRWVRRTAFRQAARWVAGGTPLRIAVNLSTRDLHNPGFGQELSDLMAEIGLPPELVELEVTDRVVMGDAALADWVRCLDGLGVRLAIDDFGTGNSVLSRLQRCPISVLKIDRSFIEPLAELGADPRLVHALISMSHALGLHVVSEGIETEAQATLLRDLGSELGQGFLFHRPMPAEDLTALLEVERRATVSS